jgi:hypothetical protein
MPRTYSPSCLNVYCSVISLFKTILQFFFFFITEGLYAGEQRILKRMQENGLQMREKS